MLPSPQDVHVAVGTGVSGEDVVVRDDDHALTVPHLLTSQHMTRRHGSTSAKPAEDQRARTLRKSLERTLHTHSQRLLRFAPGLPLKNIAHMLDVCQLQLAWMPAV